MATWSEFETDAPALAAAGRQLLYQYGPPLGFLATVRPDGGPRVHPFCPIVTNGALWAFILRHSPKGADLLRDPRFALHAFPARDLDDEFFVRGRAEQLLLNNLGKTLDCINRGAQFVEDLAHPVTLSSVARRGGTARGRPPQSSDIADESTVRLVETRRGVDLPVSRKRRRALDDEPTAGDRLALAEGQKQLG